MLYVYTYSVYVPVVEKNAVIGRELEALKVIYCRSVSQSSGVSRDGGYL